eukprot:TRINITY_DN67972_c0_g1_i1.p1 TRINITY_DN67972_c0_g1~~TRINITY_DN67972_c0_g1_i1.p1  ORF type:complete len:299 (+),score=80.58 TRINITY_DN67972_c0_g1_i1:70-966(+)
MFARQAAGQLLLRCAASGRGVRWCHNNDNGGKPEGKAESKAHASPEELPREVPLSGNHLLEWVKQTGLSIDAFGNGMVQAYSAIAYMNKLTDDEMGVDRWTRLPVDSVALEQLAANDTKTQGFNGAKMSMLVADPEDRMLSAKLCDVTLKENGEQMATVRFYVASHPRALFGDDLEVSKNLVQAIFPKSSEEEVSALSVRLLEVLYLTYFDEETAVSQHYSRRVTESWEGCRSHFSNGSVPNVYVPLPLMYLSKWILLRQAMPRRMKEWIFRRDLQGKWHLSRLKTICHRIPAHIENA